MERGRNTGFSLRGMGTQGLVERDDMGTQGLVGEG